MLRIQSLFLLLATVNAFSPLSYTTPKSTALFVAPDTIYRAVELAKDANAKDVDELDRLATEIEEFVSNYEEDSSDEVKEKELQDKMDVAEILRLQIEMVLRRDYLKNANLFAQDVVKEHDAEERKKFKDTLIANREKADTSGSDLGLW